MVNNGEYNMAIKQLYQSKITSGNDYQDSVLHSKCKDVIKIDEHVNQVITDLIDTLWAYPICIGLSAPQIGYNYKISVINFERVSKEDTVVLINPIILETTGKKDKKRESCMSVWGKQGEVERRNKVTISYQDIALNKLQSSFEGFHGRAVQHEIDHLNGILYADKLVENKELMDSPIFSNYEIIME